MKFKNINQLNFFLFFSFTFTVSWGLNVSLNLNSLSNVLNNHYQIMDLELLFLEPVKSLLFLHSQPPLLNTIIFFLNKAGNSVYENFVIFNSLLVGCVATLMLKILFDRSKNLFLSIFISLIYILFPSTLLNVSYPFYPCLTSFGYTLLLYSFHITNKKFSKSLIYFSIACILLSLTRSSFSLFHLFFFIIIFYVYNLNSKINLKKFYIAIFFVSIISLIVPFKNKFHYGFFGTSSWAPLNIGEAFGVKRQYGYFISPKKISEIYPELECKNSYHIQDKILVKSSGGSNYNSCLMIEYATIVKNEIIEGYNILDHAYRILSNTVQYFSPSDKYFFLTNRDKISDYANFINYLQLTFKLTSKLDNRNLAIHEIRVLLILLLFGALFYSYSFKNKFLFLCFLIIFIHFITHVIVGGPEGKRFIFDIEFIFFIIFGLIFQFIKDKNKVLIYN